MAVRAPLRHLKDRPTPSDRTEIADADDIGDETTKGRMSHEVVVMA
jgi:hypothetical protein